MLFCNNILQYYCFLLYLKKKHFKNLPTQNQNIWTVVYFCTKAFRKVQITLFL